MAVTVSSTTSAASIAKTLGAGSGVDLSALVTSLVDAQFAAKNAALVKQGDKLTAQISGVAKLKSGITGFSTALNALAKGGTLATALTSSDSTVVRAVATGTKGLAGFTGTIEVRKLAGAQSATTVATGLTRDAVIGTGTLTVTLGTQGTPGDASTFTPGATSFDIAIGTGDRTLDGIARKITAANRGLTASVVVDASNNARLVIKGATGEAKAFEISSVTADAGGGPGLGILDTGRVGVTTVAGTPQDAEFSYDGIAVKRATNTVADLIDGVRLELASAKPGTAVSLAGTAAAGGLNQAVQDVVAAFNEMLAVLKEETNAASGALAGDGPAGALAASLRGLTLLDLNDAAPAGAPRTLAELGVSTNRDGTLAVDTTRLAAAIARDPAAVEAMFVAGTRASGGGLPGALAAIATRATDAVSGFGAATARYTKAQTTLATQRTKAEGEAEAMRTRLTKQFSAMDARVAAYKSTQAFLEQQVKVWTRSE